MGHRLLLVLGFLLTMGSSSATFCAGRLCVAARHPGVYLTELISGTQLSSLGTVGRFCALELSLVGAEEPYWG